MIKVLVTGSMGQLGKALQNIANDFSKIQFEFKDSNQLDITELNSLRTTFKKMKGLTIALIVLPIPRLTKRRNSKRGF